MKQQLITGSKIFSVILLIIGYFIYVHYDVVYEQKRSLQKMDMSVGVQLDLKENTSTNKNH
jgi:hypothetical protein